MLNKELLSSSSSSDDVILYYLNYPTVVCSLWNGVYSWSHWGYLYNTVTFYLNESVYITCQGYVANSSYAFGSDGENEACDGRCGYTLTPSVSWETIQAILDKYNLQLKITCYFISSISASTGTITYSDLSTYGESNITNQHTNSNSTNSGTTRGIIVLSLVPTEEA